MSKPFKIEKRKTFRKYKIAQSTNANANPPNFFKWIGISRNKSGFVFSTACCPEGFIKFFTGKFNLSV